jgi:hypothetical protein
VKETRIKEVASELSFPLANFACYYGAGLASKGDESGGRQGAAEMVIIEMGYNDPENMSEQDAVSKMRKQTWFKTLSQARSDIKRVVFVRQPGYRQVAGARKRKGTQWERGQLVPGSQWTNAAAALVHDELDIATTVLEEPGEKLYAGMEIGDDGDLWQDIATCRSYTSSGVDYDKHGKPALWYDAQHPSAEGAELHFRRLVAVLQRNFILQAQPSEKNEQQ